MHAITAIAMPLYPPSPELKHAGEPHKPVAGLSWHAARAYCRYLGKDLPTSRQWVKAMRGGLVLPDGSPNPHADRNLPWGSGEVHGRAQLSGRTDEGSARTADVGSHLGDVSPYGVLDLAGNVLEWTDSPGFASGTRIVRGGGIDSRPGGRKHDLAQRRRWRSQRRPSVLLNQCNDPTRLSRARDPARVWRQRTERGRRQRSGLEPMRTERGRRQRIDLERARTWRGREQCIDLEWARTGRGRRPRFEPWIAPTRAGNP
jgi:hypothetical protein